MPKTETKTKKKECRCGLQITHSHGPRGLKDVHLPLSAFEDQEFQFPCVHEWRVIENFYVAASSAVRSFAAYCVHCLEPKVVEITLTTIKQ